MPVSEVPTEPPVQKVNTPGIGQVIEPAKDANGDAIKDLTKARTLPKIFKNKIIVIGIVLVILVAGFFGLRAFLNRPKKVYTPATNAAPTQASQAPGALTERPHLADPSKPDETSTILPDSEPLPASPAVDCKGASMPQDACAAVDSIEKKGIKNNSYVTAKTDQVPSGVTIKINRSTWIQGGPESGIIKGTATYGGKDYPGSLTFAQSTAGWRVISYDIQF